MLGNLCLLSRVKSRVPSNGICEVANFTAGVTITFYHEEEGCTRVCDRDRVILK